MIGEKAKLASRIRQVSKLTGRFELRSGAISDTYFDKYLFESDPVILESIAVEMASFIPDGSEILAGLEMGGIPIVTALSHVTSLPAAFIRKKAKKYGTCKYAEGPDLNDRRVVLVEDVVSSGGAILDAVNKLRLDGIEVIHALCVIDRQSGGREKLIQSGIELCALFSMEEIETASF